MFICDKDIRVQGRLVKVAYVDGDKFTLPGPPQTLIEGIKKSSLRADLFTFLQSVPHTEPMYGYDWEFDNLAVLPITTFEHWWNHQIKSPARNRARQAEKKGAVIREIPFDDELLAGIVDIHNETPIRQGRRFPHYGMDHEGARKYAGTFLDRSIFIGAFFEGRLIGFLKLVMDEARTYACAINILSMIQHREKAPTNAMIAQAVRVCAERGLRHLVYENFVYGNKGADSLTNFKETNGFIRMDLPRYYVPLTPLGRLALRYRLHRRLVEYVPEPLMIRFRALRSTWHQRRLAAAGGSSE